jgi:hypothetical protein
VECDVYRPRRPEGTPLYRLLESRYEPVKGAWEDRFEDRYGFWRGMVDGAVARYLDCGIFEGSRGSIAAAVDEMSCGVLV